MRRFYCIFLVAVLAVLSCVASAQSRPNILWLTSEDNSVDWIGCYGNPSASTPNIDQLAQDGFQYLHAYANAPVCAPSRSTWITGMLAISNGTFPMRSRYEIPHDRIPYYPDALRANGYYVGNDKKTDYNIGGRPDRDCWDAGGEVNWNTLEKSQPFFQVINISDSHESRAQRSVENTKHDPSTVQLRAYHPDLPDIRKNYAKYYDAISRMDSRVGELLAQLDEMGLAENTIVIYNSDHGGVLPRSKRYLFQSGLHCPLIIRIPEAYQELWPVSNPGTKVDRLVSFVDMPKTWLSLTGSAVPEIMQGAVFLGEQTEPEREFHFAFRGRMDERVENARAICTKRYLYIRNYMPYAPWMQHLEFLWKMKATQAWEEYVQSGQASEVQARFFKPKGWTEELYDMQADPDNLNNLIDNPELQKITTTLRKELRAQQVEYYDAGLIPESEMVKRAADHHLSIYDFVREPSLYNVPALLTAADLALEQNAENRPELEVLLASSDSGLRYWAAVGFFLLNESEWAHQCLEDDSHEVRALAAWALIQSGNQELGYQCLEALLKQDSYATLTVLNMIDWMNEDGEKLMPAVRALSPKTKSYEERMRNNLIGKFGDGR